MSPRKLAALVGALLPERSGDSVPPVGLAPAGSRGSGA